MIITEPVRSGRQIYAARGDLIVMGPVSAGAELLADGNIHVYSSLRGRALAGISGDTNARIFCHSLEAELVSIAGLYRVSEDLDKTVLQEAGAYLSRRRISAHGPVVMSSRNRSNQSTSKSGEASLAKVIVMTSGKGGVGKTTSSAAFATGLALRGFKTVVIDFDVGLRNLDLIMGCERRVVFDFINVINGDANLNQALIKDKRDDNLFIFPTSQTRDKDALKQRGRRDGSWTS